MLAKRPVVASINRGHRELLMDGKTGFMTNQWDDFSNRIVQLYEEETLANDIAQKALEYAQSYTLEATMKEFQKMIENCYE
jgi:glycosyltransferase EpsD